MVGLGSEHRPRRTVGALAGALLCLSGGVPEAAAQEAGRCPPDASWEDVTLGGRVVDEASGVALPSALVTAEWEEEAGEATAARARADGDGVYRLCGLPLGVRLTLRASFGDRGTEPVMARLESPPVAYDFQVPPPPEAAGATVRVAARGGPGRILGRARDSESLRPIEGAVIDLRRADAWEEEGVTGEGAGPGEGGSIQATTDSQGRFLIRDVPGGTYGLELRHVAYGTVREPIRVPAHRTLEVDLRVPPVAIELEPIVVTAVRDRRLEIKGFYERREWGEKLGLGHYFGREDIERRNPHLLSHLVADVPGVRLRCGLRARSCEIWSVRAPRHYCSRMNVYLDGMRVLRGGYNEARLGDMGVDQLVNPAEVAAVEVYTSTVEIPAEFSGSTGQCGAVVIWTRSGR